MTTPGADSANDSGGNDENNAAVTAAEDDQQDSRNRILLAVLYRQVMNYRRQRHRASSRGNNRNNGNDDDDDDDSHENMDYGSSDDEDNEQQQPSRPLRILSTQEALSLEAVCRFCFEGPDPDDQAMNDTDYNVQEDRRLIAACACTGSSEYVHVFCLRQWQMQARHNGRRSAAICRVCTTPYALPPPPPRSLRPIPKGTLLISQHDFDVGIFGRSVVLLLSGTNDAELPFGLILNKPMESSLTLPHSSRTTAVRVGGPVCGGRLGLVQYMILCCKERPNENNNDNTSDAAMDDRWSFSDPILEDGTKQIFLLKDENNFSYDRESESLLETADVDEFLRDQDAPTSASNNNSSPQQNRQPPASSSNTIVFAGFCRWGRGQLEREIKQGDIWDLAHGRIDDVTRTVSTDHASNLWNTMQPGGTTRDRILTDQEIYSHEEARVPIVPRPVFVEQELVE